MKYTHIEMGKVSKHRKKLKSMSQKDGVKYCIKHLQWKFSFIRTWWENRSNPNVYIVKFEDLIENRVEGWGKIFKKLNINIKEDKIKEILDKYTKEKMRKRNISHYRKDKKGWRDLFDKTHMRIFRQVNGNILSDLGYKK
jgi:hypothetical protein